MHCFPEIFHNLAYHSCLNYFLQQNHYFSLPYADRIGESVYRLIKDIFEGNLGQGGGIYQIQDPMTDLTVDELSEQLSGLSGLTGIPLDSSGGNCGLSPFVVGGQWHISGATGFVEPGHSGAMPETTGLNISAAHPLGSESVAIVVVDDFDGADLSRLVSYPHEVAHGYLVWDHLERLSQGAFTLVQVNTHRYLDTLTIADEINLAISDLQTSGISRIVVNMSFAVIPCTVAQDFTESGLQTFEAYANAIREQAPQLFSDIHVFEDALLAILSRAVNVSDDPFAMYLDEWCIDTSVSDDTGGISTICYREEHSIAIALVASSGNFGYSYSFFPGAFDKVTSVAALEIGTGRRWFYSNEGDVAEDGGWYEFADATGSISYIGTSFAAPAHSYRLALNLSNWP